MSDEDKRAHYLHVNRMVQAKTGEQSFLALVCLAAAVALVWLAFAEGVWFVLVFVPVFLVGAVVGFAAAADGAQLGRDVEQVLRDLGVDDPPHRIVYRGPVAWSGYNGEGPA